MSDTVIAAVIAGTVSVIGAVIAIVGSWVTNVANRRRLLKEIEGSFSQFLYKERLESFAEAFAITGKIKREKSPQYFKSYEQLQEIGNQLLDWSSGKGGLLMSGSSIKAHQELCQKIMKQPAHGDNYSKEQAEIIWNLRNEFRRALRSDVLYLTPRNRNQSSANT